ncbi:FAD assembly factor SdhE [Sulfurirhabdus autotrophica]|uniref:FAD assembly factor SdhE n=1 Tax=Sulfurirhabdus autotrophica TaxID=1706046 RepID=A0A4R3YHX4_9PROT|nr:succinate dehydrogenase assembly factor 2 [Sulfurirhabdus autotrophica]TCV90213.1 antitoxin CptB [Sulfurirhabdus autotrophica]
MTIELNRLRWRCRRGLLELDIVLERFIEHHYSSLSELEKASFIELLTEADNDLWELISGVNAVSASYNGRVLSLLRQC